MTSSPAHASLSVAYRRLALLAVLMVLPLVTGLRVQAAALWGPVLGNVTPTSIQISWRDADVAADGVLFNGTRYAGTVSERYRLVTLSDLKPDTAYKYALVTGEKQLDYTFRTPPAKPTALTFAVYGDTRSQPKIHKSVIAAIAGFAPRFVINTGDLVGNGQSATDWDTFFDVATPLTANMPYFAAAGNHEQNADIFYRLFPGAPGGGMLNREWYGTTYGPVRIVVLNSTRAVAEQRDWLETYLTAHDGEPGWTVVAFHYPPYSSSARNGDETMRKQWVPILEKHHVDIVFLGHDHFYERSEKDGVQYVIAGGGGAPLYDVGAKPNPYAKVSDRNHHYVRVDVTPTTFHMRMFHVDGTVGDELTLTKPEAVRLKTPLPLAG